jgi:hypothetical protein
MNLVFIVKNRDETPFMVIRTTPNGSTFEPMSDSAKDLAKMLRQEYGRTPITKPELVQTMDASKIIEGPSPSGTATQKKVANISIVGKELQTLPILSISEVLLSEFSDEEFKNVLTFKASSFISDQTRSSAHFEIKGVRAIWDPSLAIPGTNRRGGFRCPVGTRYGGQITDRFGRSCGWGVARRIANQIADIGERLEQRDDGKRKRRLDRRNARMIRRLGGVAETGRVEGGLRNIARRLDGGSDVAPRPVNAEREANRQQAREDLRNLGNQARDIIRPRRLRRSAEQEDAESQAPSVRVPRNRRRDVRPETEPTPRPERRPRPQVAPRPRNVDVLTPQDASDAGETEDFKPYVLRKYNEYAKRVREIRAGGGNAGMLTRREWYAFNKENLRDAWKDAHGRSAPQDFEPPTPQARRPRNNRGRRRQATAESAGRSASRKPTPDDVPEPAPGRPVRPARRPRRQPVAGDTPTGAGGGMGGAGGPDVNNEGNPKNRSKRESGVLKVGEILGPEFNLNVPYEQKFDANPPNIPSQGANRRGQIVWNPDVVRAFNQAELKIDQSNLKDTHMAIYLQNNVYIVRKIDAKNIEDAWRKNNQGGNALGYRDVNATSFPEPNAGKTPKTPPAPQKSPLKRFGRKGNPHGVLPIERGNGGLGKWVDKTDRNIDTEQKAVEHLKNGGELQKIPAKFLFEAIFQNSSADETDLNTKFRRISPSGGAIGFTQMFFLRGADGKKTNQGWVLKASDDEDNIGENVGWNYLAELGIIGDGAIADGVLQDSPNLRARLSGERYGGARIARALGKQFIVTPMAFNDVPNDHTVGPDGGGPNSDFVLSQLRQAPDRGLPVRLASLWSNFILGVADRHEGNAIGRIITAPDGKKEALVIPLDLARAGWGHNRTFAGYASGFSMDPHVMANAASGLQKITNIAVRKQTYEAIVKTFDEVVSKTEKVLSVGKTRFVADALKNQHRSPAAVRKAERLYDGMQDHLTKLRATRPTVVAFLPIDQR